MRQIVTILNLFLFSNNCSRHRHQNEQAVQLQAVHSNVHTVPNVRHQLVNLDAVPIVLNRLQCIVVPVVIFMLPMTQFNQLHRNRHHCHRHPFQQIDLLIVVNVKCQ